MSRTTTRNLLAVVAAALLSIIGCATHRAMAGEHCFHRGSMFSDGAASCQSGLLFRCDDGDWRSTGSICSSEGPMTVARTCQFGGVSYSTGSASCQAGTQFRCEDGTWRSIGLACVVGDSPIRVLPSGRTCMFGDATVANNSTICKSGTTYLCSDGEWTNLGTICR